MFVTTFYSFKGGVGRTMALMNVALDLVQKGRRVLIADFDLEAPGLATFALTRSAQDKPGVVDFIHEYLDTRRAPAIEAYTQKVPVPGGSGSLFLMTAGRQDASYGTRLAAIDWGALYAQRDGYLLLEDLRSQWQKKYNPDYVLIDSRTGHTDVSGICTRQLPDAVVLLFFPNDQNLLGLTSVIGGIRAQSMREVRLLFVPSNVPDLPDDDGIVAERLERFRTALGYEEPATVVHHSATSALLNQMVHTHERPKSALAKEYRMLTRKIQQANPRDAEGALNLLQGTMTDILLRRTKMSPEKVERMLEAIGQQHETNTAVLEGLVKAREMVGDHGEALRLLDILVDQKGETGSALRMQRATARSTVGMDRDQVIAEMRAALAVAPATPFEINQAISLADRLDSAGLYAEILNSPAFASVEAASRIRVLIRLAERPQAQASCVEPLRAHLVEGVGGPQEQLGMTNALVQALLAGGRIDEAREVLESYMRGEGKPGDFPLRFEHALVAWLHSGEVPRVLLESLVNAAIEQPHPSPAPGHLMACAMAAALTGRRDAVGSFVERAGARLRGREAFSPWTMCIVLPAEFTRHLQAITAWDGGREDGPLFARSGRER